MANPVIVWPRSKAPFSRSTRRARFVLLAPTPPARTRSFGRVEVDPGRHEDLLAAMQRLRGRIYLRDGAIRRWQLTPDQRHSLEIDDRSWHLLDMDANNEIRGCARYQVYDHQTPVQKLGVRNSALASDPQWGPSLRAGVEANLAEARSRNVDFVEIGGWAVEEGWRCTREALRVALGVYGLANLLGGAIALTTATVRHCSARILAKIGGNWLEAHGKELPAYYDPQYDCEMRILRFDSVAPPPRFQGLIDTLCAELSMSPVICRDEAPSPRTNTLAFPFRSTSQFQYAMADGGHGIDC